MDEERWSANMNRQTKKLLSTQYPTHKNQRSKHKTALHSILSSSGIPPISLLSF